MNGRWMMCALAFSLVGCGVGDDDPTPGEGKESSPSASESSEVEPAASDHGCSVRMERLAELQARSMDLGGRIQEREARAERSAEEAHELLEKKKERDEILLEIERLLAAEGEESGE